MNDKLTAEVLAALKEDWQTGMRGYHNEQTLAPPKKLLDG